MFKSEAGTVEFDWQGQSYTLVFNHRALKFYEREGDSIADAIEHLEALANGVSRPRLSVLASLIAAGLRQHHPDLTEDDALPMVADSAVLQALVDGFGEAMPPATEGEAGRDPIPPAGAKRQRKGKGSTGAD